MHMAGFRWTPQKRICATYIAMGKSRRSVAKLTGVAETTLQDWESWPEWKVFCEEISERHAETMEGLLADSERLAVMAMNELLESTDPDVKFKAAESLLNRAAKRGKPVDQMEQRSIAMTGDLNKTLQQALRDPTVIDRLAGANIKLDIPALPAGTPRPTEGVDAEILEDPDYELVPHDAGVPAAAGGRDVVPRAPDLPPVVEPDRTVQPPDGEPVQPDVGADARRDLSVQGP